MPNKRGRTLAKVMRPSSCSPISGLRRVGEVTSDIGSSAIAMDHSLFETPIPHFWRYLICAGKRYVLGKALATSRNMLQLSEVEVPEHLGRHQRVGSFSSLVARLV